MANSDIEFTRDELQQLKYLLEKARARYPGIEDIRCDGHKIWGYSFEIYSGVGKSHTETQPAGDDGFQVY